MGAGTTRSQTQLDDGQNVASTGQDGGKGASLIPPVQSGRPDDRSPRDSRGTSCCPGPREVTPRYSARIRVSQPGRCRGVYQYLHPRYRLPHRARGVARAGGVSFDSTCDAV
jgi:hypothetical protein